MFSISGVVLTRRTLLAAAGALLAACGYGTSPETAPAGGDSSATQDEAEIEEKTRNPPAAAVADDVEPPESGFTMPNPIFVPPQTLIRRWRVNTVEPNTRVDLAEVDAARSTAWSSDRSPCRTRKSCDCRATEQVTDLHCVEGWGFYDIKWEGTRLARPARAGRRQGGSDPRRASSPSRRSTPTA